MSDGNNNGNFLPGFILGGILGALIIFILGTKEGKKLLEKLVDHVENSGGDFEKKIGKIQEKGEELLEEAKDIKEKVQSGMDFALKNRRTFKKNGKKLSS